MLMADLVVTSVLANIVYVYLCANNLIIITLGKYKACHFFP